LVPISLPWAVHIADGVLTWPWLMAGFLVAGVGVLVASWRVREEEIARIALLTAAFFVASSIHVKLGPSSVHLLLNGLVGVLLGLRAPLAIVLGVTLQALLIPHGGLTTIGINATVEMIPAMLTSLAFPHLMDWLNGGRPLRRSLIVALTTLAWGIMVVFAGMVLLTNPWHDLIQLSSQAGVIFAVENFDPALRVLLHPLTIMLLVGGAILSVWIERRLEPKPEVPTGAILGAFAVMFTAFLAGLVLVADGADRWAYFASIGFVGHVPLALIEGVILGVTVGFLAKVKPELLPYTQGEGEKIVDNKDRVTPTSLPTRATRTLLMIASLLASASPARVHQLNVEKKIDLRQKKVTIESWYETGDSPKDATVTILRDDDTELIKGPLDDKGEFTFRYEQPEQLWVHVNASGGHRAVLTISAKELGAKEEGPAPPVAAEPRSRGRDILLGLTFLLSLAAFLLSWRNTQRLRKITQ
jgi:cobalt/nickel transport system permease protein